MRPLLCLAICTLVAVAAPGTARADHGTDRNCTDFETQADAQGHLDAHPGDPDGLDSDKDGVACERNPCPCAGPAPESQSSPARWPRRYRGRVLGVVDGDTLKVRLRDGRPRTVRLLGIDTPELARAGEPAECGGRAAKRRMKRLVRRGKRRVRLRTDPSQAREDAYGRLLAYVHRRRSGRDLGKAMLRSGWAAVYVFGGVPFQRVNGYERAAERAERRGRGVHRRCGGEFHRSR